MLEFFTDFPEMSRRDLRDFKKAIDGAFRDFSRENGESIESFFDPLLWFLIWLEKLLVATPWPIILLIVGGLAYLGSRSWKLAAGSMLSFVLIGYFGMWEDTMSTIICPVINTQQAGAGQFVEIVCHARTMRCHISKIKHGANTCKNRPDTPIISNRTM